MLSNRMRRRVLFFLIIFLFIKCDLSYADIDLNIKFNNITIEDGLSQSTVGNMYQDSRGYIWIGTEDGLNRYNGKEFKHYKNDKYSENSLISNYIRGIAEDTNGVMWIATLDGISRIDQNTDEIRNYSEKEDKGNLSNSNVCNILVTKDNRIFAATEDGLNLYYEKNEKFYRILDKENDLPSQYIYSVKEDSRGHIWISTDEGVVEVDKELNIVNKYEDTIGKADVYTTYDDSKGYVWVCTLDKGLFRINLNNAHVDNYRETKDKYSISSSSVRDVVLDSNGKLWVATDKGIS